MFGFLRSVTLGRVILFAVVWYFFVKPFFRSIYDGVVMIYAWMIP